MSEPNYLKLRTTIMVAGMIILPLAAVVGIKWPASLRTDQAWTTEKSPSSATTKRPMVERMPKSMPTGSTIAAMSLAASQEPADSTSPESSNYPVAHAKNIDVRLVSGSADARDAVTGNTIITASPSLAEPSEVQANDDFTRIQQRLRALGATHYALETWGATGEAYRFQCRMAAGHDAHYSRHFEATDVEPLGAMRTVLNDVESWKAGRLP